MSRSIVLDFGNSISIGRKYWQALEASSAALWQNYGINKADFGQIDLSNSLIYYYHNLLASWADVSWAERLNKIQSTLQLSVYDFRPLVKLVEAGLQLPNNAKIATRAVGVDAIQASLRLIEQVSPPAHFELKRYLSGFVIVESDTTRSLTGPTWFGAVFLGSRLLESGDLVNITTSIVHEIGHTALFAQSAMESPLADVREQIYSPFVRRTRPALMVFHAQMAMARMILWLFALKKFVLDNPHNDFENKISIERINFGITDYSRCFIDGMNQLRQLSIPEGGIPLMQDFDAIDHILQNGS